jgi:hypothetical protein
MLLLDQPPDDLAPIVGKDGRISTSMVQDDIGRSCFCGGSCFLLCEHLFENKLLGPPSSSWSTTRASSVLDDANHSVRSVNRSR